MIEQIVLPDLRDKNPQSIDLTERVELYDRLNHFMTDDLNLCSCYSKINIEEQPNEVKSCPLFNIEKRIGSDSVAGIVYLAKIDGIPTALKIMPVVDESSKTQNVNEITIAKLVSNLVVQQKSIYFPIVYGSYECKEIVYPPESAFLPQSFKYAINNELNALFERKMAENNLSMNARNKRLFKISIEKRNSEDEGKFVAEEYLVKTAEWFNENYRKFGIPDGNDITADMINPKLEGHILVSELAQMDLKQFIEQHLDAGEIISDAVWFNIIEQVLNGIDDMQKLNIIHQDLHLGNVLLLKKNEDIVCLIHDFGQSNMITRDEWIGEERSFDIKKFISFLLEYSFGSGKKSPDAMTGKFNEFIRSFLRYIQENETTERTFMDELINYFNSEKDKLLNSSSGGSYSKTNKRRRNRTHKRKRN